MIKSDSPKNATLKTGKIVKKPGKKPVPQPPTARNAARTPLVNRCPPTVGHHCRLIQYVAHGTETCVIHVIQRPKLRSESIVAPRNTTPN
jgi:hypothetical protein